MTRFPCLLAACVVLATAAPVVAQPSQPLARANRLSLALGFGLGSMSLGGLEDAAGDIQHTFEDQNVVKLSAAPSSHLEINSEVALRYYLPYYLLAQVGYGATYNWAASTFEKGPLAGELTNDNVIMEVPFLLGGYLPLAERFYVYGAAGPSYFFFARSYWDVNPGGASDFKADNGVGFHALAGADVLLTPQLALGLEVRYRLLSPGDLKDLDYGTTISSGMILGDGSRDHYDADFSSLSVGVNVRVFVM